MLMLWKKKRKRGMRAWIFINFWPLRSFQWELRRAPCTQKYMVFLHIHRELLRYQLIGFLQVNMQKQHSSSICSANWGLSDANFRFFFSLLYFYSLDVFCAFFAFFFSSLQFCLCALEIRRAGDMIQEPSKKPCEKYTNSTESILVLRLCFTAFKIFLFLHHHHLYMKVREIFMVMMIIIKT